MTANAEAIARAHRAVTAAQQALALAVEALAQAKEDDRRGRYRIGWPGDGTMTVTVDEPTRCEEVLARRRCIAPYHHRGAHVFSGGASW